jgi:hypothetical protein
MGAQEANKGFVRQTMSDGLRWIVIVLIPVARACPQSAKIAKSRAPWYNWGALFWGRRSRS